MAKKMKVIEVNGKPQLREYFDREDIIKMLNDAFDDLEGSIKRKDEVIESQAREIDRPNDEKLADAIRENEMLKEKISELYKNSLYVLSAEDRKKSQEFWSEHRKVCAGKGRHMEWVIYGTGIGSCLEYRCKTCGEKIDLTDISKW